MRIGFIGLGTMGLPMLQNLANDPGHDILALDASEQPFAALATHPAWGRTLARASGLGAFANRDVVFTMLPNSPVTNSVIRGDLQGAGLKDVLKPGARIIDAGSSNPVDTAALAQEVGQKGIGLTDAPVSGSLAKAVSGDLTFMVGTDRETLETLRPLLQPMGKVLIATGAIGSAHAMKALNNYVYAAGLLATSEAVIIAQKMGLDLDQFADVLNASSGRNVATETKLKQFILSGRFSGGFSLRLQAKDLATAATLGKLTQANAPQLSLCEEIWATAASVCAPDADNTEIYRFMKGEEG